MYGGNSGDWASDGWGECAGDGYRVLDFALTFSGAVCVYGIFAPVVLRLWWRLRPGHGGLQPHSATTISRCLYDRARDPRRGAAAASPLAEGHVCLGGYIVVRKYCGMAPDLGG